VLSMDILCGPGIDFAFSYNSWREMMRNGCVTEVRVSKKSSALIAMVWARRNQHGRC